MLKMIRENKAAEGPPQGKEAASKEKKNPFGQAGRAQAQENDDIEE